MRFIKTTLVAGQREIGGQSESRQTRRVRGDDGSLVTVKAVKMERKQAREIWEVGELPVPAERRLTILLCWVCHGEKPRTAEFQQQKSIASHFPRRVPNIEVVTGWVPLKVTWLSPCMCVCLQMSPFLYTPVTLD